MTDHAMQASLVASATGLGDDTTLADAGAAESAAAPSILTSWTRVVLRALEARSIDPDSVLRRARFPARLLADPRARVPLDASRRLWEAARSATRDEAFGIIASRFVTPSTFQALGYAVLSSETLSEAFARVERYARFVSDAADVRFVREGHRSRLTIGVLPGTPALAPEAVEAMLALMLRVAREMRGPGVRPIEVSLRREAPRDTKPFETFFGVPVRFGAPLDSMVLRADDLDAKLATADAATAKANELVVEQAMGSNQPSYSAQVRAEIATRLPSGEPSIREIARALRTSTRTLQRRLAEEERCFHEVLAETRTTLAERYLGEGRPVTEVAFLLGFGDASAFSRAFRRWTGTPPSRWRSDAGTESTVDDRRTLRHSDVVPRGTVNDEIDSIFHAG
jgi:AraC-like DNA-binding protein